LAISGCVAEPVFITSAPYTDAKTTCGMLGVAERAGLSDDEKTDWDQGCMDSLRSQGAS
jgi:hypothetical protein